MQHVSENDIAIIGMSGRFPKANNIAEYWQNLVNGVNSIEKADDEKIQAAGLPKEILEHKRFVHAGSTLNEAKYFDAEFFGLSKTEALHMDPQIRLLLQTSWHALEDAGYDTSRPDMAIGNFCGMSTNFYLFSVLNTNPLTEPVDQLLYRILNEKDFLATWISYKLNLTGPAMSVQTACSTSLLAVHLACQSLLNRECEMALAGGVSYSSDDKIGYIHVPESIFSKDGVCRPFDKDASGTVGGHGVGTVVLKRAADAIRDNDHIYALIKGTATNNDGANKQGYTTPSVNVQRDVILETLGVADIDPATIGMIEAHGTGTLIGDPIEVTALTEAFREYTSSRQYCAIGSVKSNIGHLDAAAGIASLIKTVLCVYNGALVPSINFSAPNPVLKLESSPFYVSQAHTPWPGHFNIRRAGISSLGVGGTNVHVIIEQAPQVTRKASPKRPFVMTLSASGEKNLYKQKLQLAEHIRTNPDLRLEDLEYTGIYGRKVMPRRFSAVFHNREELTAQLLGKQQEGCFEGQGNISESIFLFPGQGSQYPHMVTALYQGDLAFRKDVDHCLTYLKALFAVDFRDILFGDAGELLDKTAHTQIALFIVEYSLAKSLLRAGIKPAAFVGHSLGEYVAACIVGCLSLEDALKLVYHRGRLMGMMPEGAMLLVRATQEELSPLLQPNIHVCAVNAQDNIVIGGAEDDILQQGTLLSLNKISFIKLKVSHAYHTPMMADVLDTYEKVLAEVTFNPFTEKVFSTYTGTLIDSAAFCSRQYWLDQIMHPVKFMEAVLQVPGYIADPVFIEVGPGNGLSSFVRNIFGQQAHTVNLLPKASGKNDAIHQFYQAKALLCAKGIVFALPEIHEGRRVPLPGYAFSKHYFWKPQINVHYKAFNEIASSYHYNNERYGKDRVRTFIEFRVDKQQLSEELLEQLNGLHAQYIRDVENLISKGDQKIYNRIEVLYEDTAADNKEVQLPAAGISETGRNNGSVLVQPITETEKSIAFHWGEVLGYQAVGTLDNYFEVGGNSLLATKLMARLSDEFNTKVSFRELSECLTIKELAALIDSRKRVMELVAHVEAGDSNHDNYIEI